MKEGLKGLVGFYEISKQSALAIGNGYEAFRFWDTHTYRLWLTGRAWASGGGGGENIDLLQM